MLLKVGADADPAYLYLLQLMQRGLDTLKFKYDGAVGLEEQLAYLFHCHPKDAVEWLLAHDGDELLNLRDDPDAAALDAVEHLQCQMTAWEDAKWPD